jgi:hypothetical protein
LPAGQVSGRRLVVAGLKGSAPFFTVAGLKGSDHFLIAENLIYFMNFVDLYHWQRVA